MFLARFSVNNPVLVNLLMTVVIITGLFYYFGMPREIFPEFSTEKISITTEYPGTSPAEIEKLITIKIEDAIANIDGIDTISSESREGLSTILVKLKRDVDSVDRVINDIKSEIDALSGELPKEAEDSEVKELKTVFPVITVSLFGDLPELTMKELADDLRDELLRIKGVGRINVSGVREREIWVEVDPKKLEEYDLTLDYVRQVLESRNLNMPGGTLKTQKGEMLVRTMGEVTGVQDIENVILRSDPTGNTLYLHQVASVRDSFEEPRTIGRFNRKKSINLAIAKDKKGDILAIVKEVRAFVREYQKTLPPGVQVDVFNDLSVYVKNRLQIMKQSGAQGLILVLITLCIFLNFRTAILTAWGLPVAFLGAIILMNFFEMSLNMVSMFSFILVLGMLVDDAIVVTENVYRHIEEGKPPVEAAISGTTQVAGPVVTTILTTIAAFTPMLFMPGTIGKFMAVVPTVVIFALGVSLVEALIILPSHLADFLSPAYVKKKMRKTQTSWFDGVKNRYLQFLKLTLEWRYVSIAVSLGVTIILVAFALKFIPLIFFGEIESTQFFINIEAPVTSKLEDTSALLEKIEEVVYTLPENELKTVFANAGFIFIDETKAEHGSYVGQVAVELTEATQRERTSEDVIRELRDKIRSVPGIVKVQFVRPGAGPSGPAIELLVIGPDFDTRLEIANKIKADLATFPAVQDIRDDATPGKKEVRIFAKETARSLGLDIRSIALQVQQGFSGAESSKIQKSDEDIPIMVKFPESYRTDVAHIERMKLTTPTGEKVVFSDVASIEEDWGYTKIVRDDRKRATTILADIDQKKGTASEVVGQILEKYKNLDAQYRGYKLEAKGEQKDLEESTQFLFKAFGAALLLIYLILGGLFKSYIQPFIVMFAIPFAIDGVIIGHYVMGENLSFLSMMGVVALTGVVVNDSLILVDFINNLRSQGIETLKAVLQAAQLRLRPILLTTITTVAGLSPLAFFATGQAKFLSPMAIAITWGLSFATLLTLVIVPCLYLIVDDVARASRRLVFGKEKEIEEETIVLSEIENVLAYTKKDESHIPLRYP